MICPNCSHIFFKTVRSARIRSYKGLKLTKRQEEVLLLVEKGLNNAEIADLLYLTVTGVKFHLSSIYKLEPLKHVQNQRAKLIFYLLNYKEEEHAAASSP